MSDERGPTTEELRARVLAQLDRADVIEGSANALADIGANYAASAARQIARRVRTDAETIAAELPRPCLACNREQGERMCDLCQRLEIAEAAAPPLDSEGAERP